MTSIVFTVIQSRRRARLESRSCDSPSRRARLTLCREAAISAQGFHKYGPATGFRPESTSNPAHAGMQFQAAQYSNTPKLHPTPRGRIRGRGRGRERSASRGRPDVSGLLVPDIPFVKSGAMAFKKFPNPPPDICEFSMVFGLIADVGGDGIDIRLAYREGPVTVSPTETVNPFLFQPL